MPTLDCSPGRVAADGLYPQALTLSNARISEVFTLRLTAASRRRSRLASLRRQYAQWAGKPPVNAAAAAETVIAIVGPCTERACCSGDGRTDCHQDGCLCTVVRHPAHPGEEWSELSDLAAALHADAVLSGRRAP